MSILTKPSNPLSAATEYGFELSIPELLQLVQSVTNSDYWEDISNWREVDFVYVNAQKQYQRIVFDLASNEVEVDYAFNENCINGLFECGRITVFGYVNDSLRIKRSFYDNEFDIVIVDGIDLGTTIVINSVTPPAFGTYSEGDVLTFTLNFSDLVNITGLSLLNEDGTLVLLEDEYALLLEDTRLAILVGSEIRYATYVSGSESANVVYEYVVQAGDQDLDGIEILSLDLNGGVIIGVNGESVNITIPTTDTSGVLIDNSAPDIIAPTITDILVSDGIYEDQDDIIFTVEFSENVLVSGSPVLTLDIGGVTRQAALLSSSLNQAVFSYTVEQPDNDNNGIEIVSLDNGVITDAALNPLDRTLPVVDTSNVFVSTVAPDTTAPTILSITALNGTYKAGDNLNFTATFSEPVVITGTPYLLVDIGGTQVQANMTSNNSADATFSYTVLAGQLDTDGVQVLSLDSAVITDNALNLLDRTLPSMDMSLVKVDAVAPSIVNIILPSNGYYGWYTLDEQLNFVEGNIQLNFSVQFDEVVFVSGVPRLRIKIGENASDITVREALYQNGHGTDTLLFTYTILEPELDLDGIVLIGFTAGYGSIYDAAFNLANLEFNPLDYNTSGILVDSVIPIINSITPPSTGYYNSGDQLDFIVNYNDNVIVNTSLGTPYMTLTILDFYDSVGTPVQVSYVSGSGSSQLLFRYTVPNTNYILASISLSSPINLNGGTIRDVAGNHAPLNFSGLIPSTANIFIDTISPTITNIDAPTNGTYGVGQHLFCRFFFSEWVVVTGTPTVNVVIGSSTKTFQYLNGSNSNALDFRYTVVSGDNDADGIVLDSSILLPGGATIRDLAGNNATLTFTPLSTPNVRIDTTAPVINSVTPPSAGQYGVGQQLNFTFNFSETVNVTGTPSFTITIGATNVSATYVSGSGSSQLLFRYTVLAGQNDSNGIAVSSPIVLNGGTIRDAALNNATLTFTPPTTTGVIVDTTAPTITSMSAPADDNYSTGEVISFVANFSENVVVTGTPFLQITIGSSAKQFDYTAGSGTNSLTFSYTVLSGDLDEDGISFASNSIQAPSATIRDATGNNATLSFTAPTTTGILVNYNQFINMTFRDSGHIFGDTRDVHVSVFNAIYTGTWGFGLGISQNNGNDFTYKTTSTTSIGSNFISGIWVSPSSSTIYASTSNGLSRSTNSGSSFTTFISSNSNILSNAVNDVYVDSSGKAYAATSLGLSILPSGSNTFQNSLININTSAVYVDSSGTIYVGTTGNGLRMSTDGGVSFINKTTANGLGNNSVWGVYVDSSGTIYVGTLGGLSISTDGGVSFINKTTANGLGNNWVRKVYVDGSGNIYAPTSGGLSISTDGGASFINKTTASGLRVNDIVAVAVNSNGTLYVAANGGLSISN